MGNFNDELDSRFAQLVPFERKIWLALPTMHGKNRDMWMRVSTVGENINEVERITAKK